jgi:flagellar motor switch protein FliM
MAVDVLNQDEIDALLHGVDSGEVNTSPPPDPNVARTYDFANQTRIVRGRMPTLEMINERFARALRLSLFSMIRRTPEISTSAIETPKFADYLPTLQVPTSLNHVRVSTLAGIALIIFEPRLIFSIIDSYFGGNGRHSKIEGRDFTPTEYRIIQMLLQQVFAGLKEAWMPVLDLDFEFLNSEVNPHFANIVTPTEIVVVSKFRIEMEGGGGDIHVTLPYNMLEPLKETLRAGMQSDRGDRDERWSQSLRNELEDADVEVVTQLCQARLTLGELIDMKPGDIIPCNFDGHATVMADGLPLMQGEVGQQNGLQVVKVSRLLGRKQGNSLDAFVRGARQ